MAGTLTKLSVDDSGSTLSISPVAHFVQIENAGSKTAYIEINASASTNNYPLEAGKIIKIGVKNISSVNAICASGESTTLWVNSAGEL